MHHDFLRASVRLLVSVLIPASAFFHVADAAENRRPAFRYVQHLAITDPAHVDPANPGLSFAWTMNERGVLVGETYRTVAGGGVAAWIKGPQRPLQLIGFYDALHTAADGQQNSSASLLNARGQTVGGSTRYLDGSYAGGTAWWANVRGVTTRIGFYDAEHTAPAATPDGPQPSILPGTQFSSALFFTDAGFILGTSAKYTAPDANGQQLELHSAWLARTHGRTVLVGLRDAEHTYVEDGREFHHMEISGLNEAGQSIGLSYRLGNQTREQLPVGLGHSAWISDRRGQTRRIGFYDADHTGFNGEQFSFVFELIESGYATGGSYQFQPTGDLGVTPWVANAAGETTRLGIYDDEHTGPNGAHNGHVADISESGYIAGFSSRYGEDFWPMTDTAWIATVDGNVQRVGLTDPDHTNAEGVSSSQAWNVAESGEAVGLSQVYLGGSVSLGQTLWIARPDGQTQAIGLGGIEHTPADGVPFNDTYGFAAAGVVIGTTQRYAGGTQYLGNSAWVARFGEPTIRVGLTDAVHTRDDGYQNSWISQSATSRLVWGGSERFHGDNTQDGQTAWIYDVVTGHLRTFEISVRASDGYAYSAVHDANEQGVVVGKYRLFDENGVDLGDRAFAFVPGRGVLDIGENLNVDLEDTEWLYLQEAVFLNERGFIAGRGILTDGDPDEPSAFLVKLVRGRP